MRSLLPFVGVALGASVACSTGTSADAGTGGSTGTPPPTFAGYIVLGRDGVALQATAGDDVPLIVVQLLSNGSAIPLPAGAQVAWGEGAEPDGGPFPYPTAVTALAPGSSSPNPIPAFGSQPTAIWIDNPSRPDHATDLNGVVFILDLGTPSTAPDGGEASGDAGVDLPADSIAIAAAVSGAGSTGVAAGTVTLSESSAGGSAIRGAALYGVSCALCHGATGHGSDLNPDGGTYNTDAGTYLIAGQPYGFPAPGINAEPGNLASDAGWNGALLAMTCRADLNIQGVALRLPMPNWLSSPIADGGSILTTQDYADLFAFLQTQTH